MTAPPPDVPGPVPEADYQGSHSGKPAAVMPLPSGSLLSCSWVPILLLTSLNSRLDMGTPADECTVASIAPADMGTLCRPAHRGLYSLQQRETG